MILLQDSNGNTITKIEEGCAIKFHDRLIINLLFSWKKEIQTQKHNKPIYRTIQIN